MPPSPCRILAFWPASDFDEFFTPAFLRTPEFQVEIVSGDRTSGKSPHAAGRARLADLRRRLQRGEFDLVLSGTVWNTAWPPHKRLATRLAQAFRYHTYKRGMLDTYLAPGFARVAARVGIPFAVVDVRDACFVYPWDGPLLRDGFLYFKRELFSWPKRSLGPLQLYAGEEVYRYESKLRPLSYGVPAESMPAQVPPFDARDIDVLMTGLGNPVREEMARRLEKLAGEFKIVVHPTKIGRTDYINALARSKLVLCTESAGCETWRMYEASAAGAVPLLNWPYVQNAFPFLPGQHAIYFSLFGDDLERQIRLALASPQKLAAIAQATREHTLTHKDRVALGRYVVETTLREFAGRETKQPS